MLTVLAGTGQTCVAAINSLTFLPAGTSPVYTAPASPTATSTTQYFTQITIGQSVAPIFDPNTGLLIASGSMEITNVSNLR